MAIKRPSTFVSPNRDVQTQADGLRNVLKQADNLFSSINGRLGVIQSPGVISPDAYTFLWWPCTDYIDIGATGSVINRASGSASLVVTGSATNEEGLTPGGKGFSRIFGTTGEYSGATSVVPTSGSVSLSAWVRLGDVINRNILGYYVAGALRFGIYTDASGRLTATVVTAAGTKTTGGVDALKLSPNTWYFLWMSFSGTAVSVGVDTQAISSSPFAVTSISWGAGSWKIGLAGATSGVGLYRDIRVHSRLIDMDFVNNSYAAWHRLVDRNA